jgi:hypothetical protein
MVCDGDANNASLYLTPPIERFSFNLLLIYESAIKSTKFRRGAKVIFFPLSKVTYRLHESLFNI